MENTDDVMSKDNDILQRNIGGKSTGSTGNVMQLIMEENAELSERGSQRNTSTKQT